MQTLSPCKTRLPQKSMRLPGIWPALLLTQSENDAQSWDSYRKQTCSLKTTSPLDHTRETQPQFGWVGGIFTPDSNLLQPTCEAKGRNTAGNTQTCTSCNVIGYKNGKQCQLKRALWLALAWMFTYGDPIIIDVLECILAAVYYLSGWLYWDGWEKGQLTQVTLLPPKWDQRTRRPKSGPHEDKYRLWLDKSNKNRTCSI